MPATASNIFSAVVIVNVGSPPCITWNAHMHTMITTLLPIGAAAVIAKRRFA